MTEIEIKAHVADPQETEKILRGFANFTKECLKSDTYWKRVDGGAGSQGDTEREIDSQTIAAAIATSMTFAFAIIATICVLAGLDKSIAIYVCLGGFIFTTAFTWLLKRGIDRANAAEPEGRSRGESREAPDNGVKVRVRDENGAIFVTYKRKELRGDTEVNDEREFRIDDRAAFESFIADIGFTPCITKEKSTKSFSYMAPDGTEVTIELSLVTGLGWFIELEILADNPSDDDTARAQRTLRSALALAGIPESAIERRYYTDMLREIARP